MKRGFSFSLPVTVVISAIAFIYFCTVFIFIDRWFGLMTSPGVMNAVVFTGVAVTCVLNYGFAISTDPGRVPSSFMPDIEDSEVPIHEIKRKVLLVGSLTNDSQNDEQQSADSFRTAYVICGLLLVPLSVALSVLLGWHIYLILQNKTTIEYHEGVRAMWLAEKGGNVYKHPYDLGSYENLTTVLGPSIFCWICPTSRHIGNGLRFRTAYDGKSAASISE
ncbi:DHHC-type zinc finger family protein isoform 5 [Theobroma cacao]|uniref:DHHC-type zinc finger family protein isoform 5 n=1 Tax=Theobroma cacao TaxID=3641 RepID=A0A061ESV5_THECC|nr:DHHC-type zinc finger family protein isoform 5 [Theobroma cacao]